jgi:DNA gyrase subunit A
LVNGSQGIAVGMATSIPPHNLGEIIDACAAQIDAGAEVLPAKTLLKYVKGPDFPTGGQLFASKSDLAAVYETGSGTLKLRGEYTVEERKGGVPTLVLTSLPYGVIRGQLVEKIAEIILSKKLAPLVDVRDESTTEVRIVLELKKGSDPQLVMAYLFKHTALQTTVPINLTCLVPGEVPEGSVPSDEELDASAHDPDGEGVALPEELVPCTPERLGLGAMIRHFLDFRMLTVKRRLRYDLSQLNKRIHILEGFAKVFDALDETIRIIRKSEGKADAADKLMKRFDLTETQVDAILELKLYRLARLEILLITNELEAKRREARALEAMLKSEAKRWNLIKGELLEIKATYGDKRRTKVVGSTEETEYSAEDFIIAEDANVILTQQGWLKRVREVKDLSTTRTREGDAVHTVIAGSTRASVALFSSLGTCYVMRIHDVPSTTGYGEPVQKFFKMADGERIVAMMSFDDRVLSIPEAVDGGEPQAPFALAVTRTGSSFRFSLSSHREPSKSNGRKFGKIGEGDEVLLVGVVGEKDGVLAVTSDGYALGVPVHEVGILSGVGKGTALMKLGKDAVIVGAAITVSAGDTITAETPKGKAWEMTYREFRGHRGETGSQVLKRDGFVRIVPPAPTVPSLEAN